MCTYVYSLGAQHDRDNNSCSDMCTYIYSLGAQHDGDNNSCSELDQFIMASVPHPLAKSTFNNSFTFSSCSIDYFRTYLGYLTL